MQNTTHKKNATHQPKLMGSAESNPGAQGGKTPTGTMPTKGCEYVKCCSGHKAKQSSPLPLGGRVGQLGPDHLPVVRKQVFPGNLASSESLYGHSRLDGWLLMTRNPGTNIWCRNTQERCQRGLAATHLLSPFFQVHTPIISPGVSLVNSHSVIPFLTQSV